VKTQALADYARDLPSVSGQRVLSILGSTGSIGCSALEVVAQNPDRFRVHSLVAGSNVKLLAEQALQFNPELVICADKKKFAELSALLQGKFKGVVATGEDAILAAVAESSVDLVLAAIVGVAGLRPVYAALKADKIVALANKESLVSAGQFIAEIVASGRGKIVPVDSEHSAIFQVLQSERLSEVSAIILTASGGPFLNLPKEKFSEVTRTQALKHPNWSMGSKITIDSATMMNKALELIEAYWLYGQDQTKLKVLIHPQSIIHSLIETCDGSQLAQLSVPDMKGAIAYALNYPTGRLNNIMPNLNLAELQKLEFFAPDTDKFKGLDLAYQCMQQGGVASAVFNLANELAVASFLEEKIRFDQIFSFVQQALESEYESVKSIEDLLVLLEELKLKLQVNLK
jgi:1-deoxy-D-xylulose-5-phosphate reductoisomerase